MNSKVSFQYNKIGQIIREEQNGQWIERASDPEDRLLSIRTSWGNAIQYEYDNSNRLTGILLPNNKSIEFERDLLGREIRRSLSDRLELLTGYDTAGQMLFQKAFQNGVEISERFYGYNAKGLLSKFARAYDGWEAYYDKADRLVEVAHIDRSLSETFEMDPCGNITLKDNTREAVYDTGNLLTSFGSTRYENDRCGNRTAAKDDEGTTHTCCMNR